MMREKPSTSDVESSSVALPVPVAGLGRLSRNAAWAVRRVFLRNRSQSFAALRKGTKAFLRSTREGTRTVFYFARNVARAAYWTTRRFLLRSKKRFASPFRSKKPRQPVKHRKSAPPILRKAKPLVVPKSPLARKQERYRLFAESALAYAREFQPDIVHAHDFSTLPAATKIQEELQVDFIYDSHELWTERNRTGGLPLEGERNWELEVEERGIRQAALCITVCESIAEHLKRQYGVEKPLVVRNTPYRAPAASLSEKGLRKKLGFDGSDFVTVYVGKLTANRGLTDILQALAKTQKNVRFVALGPLDPKFQPTFESAIESLGLRGRAFHHREVPQEKIVELLSDCDLSLVTMNRSCLSYAYALPNKLFESIQANLPIIGPDSPEIAQVLDRYGCGTVYRDGDAADLAAKIEALAKDPQRLAAYRAGANAASGELCWENEAKRLIDAYEKLTLSKLPVRQPDAILAS